MPHEIVIPPRSSRTHSPSGRHANLHRETTPPQPGGEATHLAVGDEPNHLFPHALLASLRRMLQDGSEDPVDEQQRRAEEARQQRAEREEQRARTDPRAVELALLLREPCLPDPQISELTPGLCPVHEVSNNSPARPHAAETAQRPAAVLPAPEAKAKRKRELLDVVARARQAFQTECAPSRAPLPDEQVRFTNFLAFHAPWQQALSGHPAYAAEVQLLDKAFSNEPFAKKVETETEAAMERAGIPPAERDQARLHFAPAAALGLMQERWQALTELALYDLGVY